MSRLFILLLSRQISCASAHLPSSESTHTPKRLQLNKTSALKLSHHYNQNEVLNYCRRPFTFRGKRVRSTRKPNHPRKSRPFCFLSAVAFDFGQSKYPIITRRVLLYSNCLTLCCRGALANLGRRVKASLRLKTIRAAAPSAKQASTMPRRVDHNYCRRYDGRVDIEPR